MENYEPITANGDASNGFYHVSPDRREHVRYVISVALEGYPDLLDNVNDFMEPAQTNIYNIRAGYGPYHGDDRAMMKFLLLEYHNISREEIELTLQETPQEQ